MELSAGKRIGLSFCVGVWSLLVQFIFNRIIFFYIANSEYVAASIISIHLAGFWLGTLIARRWHPDVLTLVGATLVVTMLANVIVWRVGATLMGLPLTVASAVLFGLLLAGLSGALVVRLMGGDTRDGRGVVIADSAGSVLGAFCGGFILIPNFGIGMSFAIVLGLQAVVLSGLLLSCRPGRMAALGLSIPVLAALSLIITAPGMGRKGMIVVDGLPIEHAGVEAGKVLYTENTPYGILTVLDEAEKARLLLIDNRPLCHTTPQGMEQHSEWIVAKTPIEMMKWSVHDKLLAANIGLGCGTSLSAMLSALGTTAALDLVEINPGMPSAQKHFWDHQKYNLSDPRVTKHIEDGFRFFAERKEEALYDAIAIDLAWMQNMNATHLFSKEMYQNVARNLRDDGVLGIWSEERNPFSPVSLIIYRTLREVFPHVVVDASTDVVLFYASKTRGDMLNFLPESTRAVNTWIGEIGMSAPVNQLDNLVMNRHKFTLFGDSKWELLFEKYQ